MEDQKKIPVCRVLKILQETDSWSGKLRLQVIRWHDGRPCLEKREYWVDKEDNNKERPGKSRGLNLEDFNLVLANQEEIIQLLTGETKCSS